MKPTESIPSFGKKTKYRGIEFKSQCEARWAALFDLMEWKWEYEPNGDCTFPDFGLDFGPDETGLLVEVKGAIGDYTRDLRVEVPAGFTGAKSDRKSVWGDRLSEENTKWFVALPSDWVRHPDAIKARECAAALHTGFINIADANGNVWVPTDSGDIIKNPWPWRRTRFNGQSEYFWDRTRVMVTGRGKL